MNLKPRKGTVVNATGVQRKDNDHDSGQKGKLRDARTCAVREVCIPEEKKMRIKSPRLNCGPST